MDEKTTKLFADEKEHKQFEANKSPEFCRVNQVRFRTGYLTKGYVDLNLLKGFEGLLPSSSQSKRLYEKNYQTLFNYCFLLNLFLL